MSSEGQGMTNLDDLLGSTQVSSEKKGFSWADAPVDSPVEDKPSAKKAAWGSVQAAPAISIKDQEAEAEKARAQGRAPPQQRVLNAEGVVKAAPVEKPFALSSGGVASANWTSRRADERPGGGMMDSGRPRYDDRPQGRYDDRPQGRYDDRPRYDGGMDGGRPERRERVEVPFPTQAPYVLYLSGLPYEGLETDVLELLPGFFGEELNAQVKNVKVPIKDGKLRHAFIEFADADALREALTLSGREFMGRNVACLVADQPSNGRRDDDRTRWGPGSGGGSSSGFGSSFGRRDNNNSSSNFGESRDRQRPPRFEERPSVERKPLNLAPRSVESSSTSSAGSGADKLDPFGGATASQRDIYAEKPRQAPAPRKQEAPAATASSTGASGPRAPAKPTEESRADTRDWKSRDFKPSTYNSSSSGEGPRAGGRGSGYRGGASSGAAPQQQKQQRSTGSADGEWKSAGGKSQQQQQQRSKPAPLSSGNNQGEASNPFDLLGNE